MKAPDKIYVPQYNIEAGNIQELDELIVAGSMEYIRKDTLLEWAKEKNKRIDAKEGNYSVGYISAMIDLVEKIKSL